MDKTKLIFFKDIYNNLPENSNEATVEQNLVIPFLEFLGYKKEWGTPQKRIDIDNTCDRFIKSPTGDKLIVEIKRKNHVIIDNDKLQIQRYLNGEAIEWGILTNGNEYLLINHMLHDLKPIEKYCLRFDLIRGKFHPISKAMNDMFLNYFTYDYIFNKKASRYFSEFQRFKVKSLCNSSYYSIKQYESANFNFFNYITHDINYTVNLNDLNTRNLIKYFKSQLNKKELDTKTILNKFRYIKSFVDFLEKEDILSNKNDFSKITGKELIEQLGLKDIPKENTIITIDEIKHLLDYQKNDSKNGLRNILVLQSICYLGLSREQIICINFDEKNPQKSDLKRNNKTYTLRINNINIKFPESMTENLDTYIRQRKKDKIKFSNLFYSQYTINNNKFIPLSESTINQIINESFNKITEIPEDRRRKLNFSLLRKAIVNILYSNGFSLEELSQITGLTVDSIYKSLMNSNMLIEKNTKVYNKLFNNHPLKGTIF